MIDDKTIEQLENSAMKMTVTVSADGAREAYDEVLGKYRKNAQIRGFRRGKAPTEVLVRKFGEGINHSAAADLVDEAVSRALKDVERQPISRPHLEELPNLELGRPFRFAVTYDVFPEVAVGEYRDLKVVRPNVLISKEDEAAELESIRERNALVEEKEGGCIEPGDLVVMDFVELAGDETPLESTRRRGFVFTVGRDEHPYNVDTAIEGMQVGDEKIVEAAADGADSSEGAAPFRLKVAITAVKERKLPELDDELAQDVSEDLKTLGDLRKKIKTNLQDRVTGMIRAQMIADITKTLREEAVIDLPASMVAEEVERRWSHQVEHSGGSEEDVINMLAQNGTSKADFLAGLKEAAEESIKTSLVCGKIIKMENISVDDDEIGAEIEKRADELSVSAEDLEKRFGGEQFRSYLRNQLVQEKLFDFLLDAAAVSKGEKIEYAQFMTA